MNIRPPETRLFADPTKRKRYLFALTMILLMVAVAELSGEKEIIFPEMAALTVGMWIVDKRVWQVSRMRMVILMTVCMTVFGQIASGSKGWAIITGFFTYLPYNFTIALPIQMLIVAPLSFRLVKWLCTVKPSAAAH